MAVPLDVQYTTQEQYNNLRLVAAYSELQNSVSLHSGAVLSLKAPDTDMQLTQLNTICRYLAEAGNRKEQLLGSSPAAKAQASEWLSFRNTGMSPVTEATLHKISSHLLTRIFLADSQPTLADLCLFVTLHRAVRTLAKQVSLPPAQTDRYCNLIRWFDHMQHTVDTTGVLSKVYFRKPGLPELVPPVLATPSKPAAAATAPEKGAAPVKGPAATESNSKAAAASDGKANTSKAAAKDPSSAKDPSAKQGPPQSTNQAGSEQAPSAQGGKPEDPAKEAKKAARKEARREAEPKKAEEAHIDNLDIRVGKIVAVELHPTADTLYVEQIDLGEEKPRQVVSGLRKHVSLEEMNGRLVVVCCNLKPAKMREVMSYGMVLCASTAEKVSPLAPPPGTAPGAKVTVSGYDEEALAEVNPKKKILEKLKPDMATDASGAAMFKTVPFMCGGQPITSTVPSGSVG